MNIEFYFDTTGFLQKKIWVKIGNQPFDDFDKLTPEEIETMFHYITEYSSKAHQALLHLSRHIRTGKRDILKQFIHCNWIIIDSKPDIGERILNFEAVCCPHKNSGQCPYDGIGKVCIKPY
jgi:hypothetical protein